MKVLLTGGTGFIATHVLHELLEHGHKVVTTVRSDEKGRILLDLFKGKPVSYSIVGDIALEGAFDEAVKSDPPFDAVIHTASPFHYNVKDNKKDLLDPAVMGTTGILKAIKSSAPSVKRVVITSSFAAMANPQNPPKVYNEEIWNQMTMDEALTTTNAQAVYRASKTFAEKAAWEFVKTEKPTFSLTVLNPPMVYGPIRHHVASLAELNTSNKLILDLMLGKPRDGPAPSPIYIDVRDLALAHVLAIENPEAAGQRFFVTAGMGTEKDMGDIIRKAFPDVAKNLRDDLADSLPPYAIDNSKSIKVLGMKYRSLEETIVDTVKSLRELGA
ncbi:dihydroflavonol-4-reductase [Capronia coronata CBS 617.96]|uniref:Dihydroflavonol-4-reductase n=1 Tax=Capronia coronata CBS 617.96 TaxID=1182541 RepID=W9YN18_9EURO|nr:dihydroflavonol-4-reductase [Capronia coronata CBS 617.96]EXJ93923.1 dihydroflavonol-4-reductase [Capronia coronata CBS 617.96]